MGGIGKKPVRSPESKKLAQQGRTKANKIRRLEAMLVQNPDNPVVRQRLEFWRLQK